MKRNIRNLFTGTLLVALSCGILSCKKIFDIAPENALEYDRAYRNVYDADAAVWGIYGKVMGLADRYIVLNELRGDLEDETSLSNKYIKEINEHKVSESNPWADPKPFYEVIINCNDALANFDKMLADTRLSQVDYNLRYSEIGAVRSWIYLQLGIHYGEVPYVTDPLASINDVKDESKYPKISFDQLITNLVNFTSSLPNIDPIPTGSTLLRTIDGYPTTKMFVNKYCLLGDLYLWKSDWMNAAVYYNKIVNYADIQYPAKNSEQWYETYKVAYTGNLTGGNWFNIFGQPYNERYSNYEIIWNIPFDKNYSPKNPFISLFAKEGGTYQIKPSLLAIQNWDKQTRIGNSVLDINRGEDKSYRDRTNPEILKLNPTYNFRSPFETGGKWILYRAALLHLRIAEAAVNVGYDKIAYSLLNYGITNAYDPTYNESTRTASTANRNVTNIQQTLSDVTSPFYFDGRFGTNPPYRGAYHRSTGIRNRVGLVPVRVDSVQYFDFSVPGNPNKAVTDRPGLTMAMEDLLINEGALELAFEGNRWPDLLRIALRRKLVDPDYLANKIAAKFEVKGDNATALEVRSRLSDPKKWYLPFKM